MARSLFLLSFIFIVVVASIHARSIEHHVITRAVCPAGMCLSKFGYCGATIDYCGAGCQAGACYGGPCPPGMCLSRFGFCGISDAYCGVGCRAGPCYGGATTLPSAVNITLPSGISPGPCPAGMCLSKFGYCGATIDYCGAGCQAGACYGGPCPPGMCLSQHGFCGISDAYCGVGCRAGPCYGGAITLPPIVTVTLPPIFTVTLPSIGTSTLSSIGTSDPPSIGTSALSSIDTPDPPSIGTTSLPSGVDDHSGDGTFYDPGLGACGFTNTGTEFVAAVAAPDFDPNTPNGNPNRNSLCGRRILVTGPKGTITVIAADRCPVCKSGDLDLSPAAFDQIADPSAGRVPITWHFI